MEFMFPLGSKSNPIIYYFLKHSEIEGLHYASCLGVVQEMVDFIGVFSSGGTCIHLLNLKPIHLQNFNTRIGHISVFLVEQSVGRGIFIRVGSQHRRIERVLHPFDLIVSGNCDESVRVQIGDEVTGDLNHRKAYPYFEAPSYNRYRVQLSCQLLFLHYQSTLITYNYHYFFTIYSQGIALSMYTLGLGLPFSSKVSLRTQLMVQQWLTTAILVDLNLLAYSFSFSFIFYDLLIRSKLFQKLRVCLKYSFIHLARSSQEVAEFYNSHASYIFCFYSVWFQMYHEPYLPSIREKSKLGHSSLPFVRLQLISHGLLRDYDRIGQTIMGPFVYPSKMMRQVERARYKGETRTKSTS